MKSLSAENYLQYLKQLFNEDNPFLKGASCYHWETHVWLYFTCILTILYIIRIT